MLSLSNVHACRPSICENGVRLVLTNDSMACAIESIPVTAVTFGGCVNVTSGSSTAMRNAAFLSPHAIFRWLDPSAMRAYDWASLPVPAVVGTPIEGSIGLVALPTPW